MANVNEMRPVKFGFDDIGPHDGWTDGSTWNGFLNIWTTLETHKKIVAEFDDWREAARLGPKCEEDLEFDNLEADEDGHVSYAMGYTTHEWQDDEPSPYHQWKGCAIKTTDLSAHSEIPDHGEGLVYPDGSWIEATKDGYHWMFSAIVGNQEFASRHLGAVEWWLWRYWAKDHVEGPDETVAKVAGEFSKQLRDVLSEQEMEFVLQRNDVETDKNICHSHDFCDANMVMDAAFRSLGIPTLTDRDERDTEGRNRSTNLWNAAWDLAKRDRFAVATQ